MIATNSPSFIVSDASVSYTHLIVVANLVVIFTKASASAVRVNEVLEQQPGIEDKGNENIKADGSTSTPKIEFDNVSFSYGSGDDALTDVSVRIMREMCIRDRNRGAYLSGILY